MAEPTRAKTRPTTPRARAGLTALVDAGATRDAERPHLPPPDVPLATPEMRIFLRVTENDVHANRDGGKVALTGLAGRFDRRLVGAYLTLVFDHDDPMWGFPALREDMEGTVYELLLRETTLDQVPPNPDQPPPESALRARVAELERENAALRAGTRVVVTHDGPIDASPTPAAPEPDPPAAAQR